jgi:hypothetical protein
LASPLANNSNNSEPSADSFREELKAEYEKDFELKERLDNKANNIVTMAGLVAAIFAGFITFVLEDAVAPNFWLLIASIIALLVELYFLVKTIQSSITSTKVANYQHVFLWSHFINDKDELNHMRINEWKQATRKQFNDTLIQDYLKCSRRNHELNEKKASDIEKAQKYFFRAIAVIPIAAFLAIVTRLTG